MSGLKLDCLLNKLVEKAEEINADSTVLTYGVKVPSHPDFKAELQITVTRKFKVGGDDGE